MSSSSTSVPESQDQIALEGPCNRAEDPEGIRRTSQPTDAESRLREHIARVEALDAQLEAASRGRSRRRRRKFNKNVPAAPLDRHRRKCQICRHPDREFIEADFVEWRHPNGICDDYKVGYFALYRHARATGLLQQRAEHVSIVVQRIVEEVESVEVTSPFAILRGVHILASLNSHGQWTAPTTTHVVVSATKPPVESVSAVTATESPTSDALVREVAREVGPEVVPVARHSSLVTPHCSSRYQYSNRKTYEKLEVDVTHT